MLASIGKGGISMWDLGTAALAVVAATCGAPVLPPIARGAGGLLAVIGLLCVMHGR